MYTKNADGTQGMIPINNANTDAAEGRIPIYGTSGRMRVGSPVNNNDATPKQYCDSTYIIKPSIPTSDGVYTLKLTVDGGVATFSFVIDS